MHGSYRNALALSVGIGLVSLLSLHAPPLLYLSLLTLLILRPPENRNARGVSFAVLLGALVMSMSLAEQARVEQQRSDVLDDREIEVLRGTLAGPMESQPGRVRVLLQTETEKIWLSIYDDLGHSATEFLPGQRIEVSARLERPIGLRGLGTSNRRYQVMARGASLIATASVLDVKVISKEFSAWSLPTRWQRWAVRKIREQPGSRDGRAIVSALSTGNKASMSEPLLSAVRASGLAHLLAVSGMHMAAVIALIYFVVIRLWCSTPLCLRVEPKTMAAGAALLGALFFSAITGARPSTCRALLVAVLVLVGMILDRRIRLGQALAQAATVLLLWRPVLLWDVGFQMSFAATFTLVFVFSREEQALRLHPPSYWRKISRSVWSLARASFWAGIATAPIALYHFGELSVIGVLSNILIVPIVTAFVLPFSIIGVVLTTISQAAGTFLLWPCIAVSGWIASLCYWIEDKVPLARCPPLSWGEGFLLMGAAILYLTRRSQIQNYSAIPMLRYGHRRFRAVVWTVVLALFVHSRLQGAQPPDSVRITFVDVGQGDAALIELPGGQVWLVDGGGLPFVAPSDHVNVQKLAQSPARRSLLPLLRTRRIHHIDLAIISHSHPDHYIGLQAVADRMPIRELWTVHGGPGDPRRGDYGAWLDKLRGTGTLVRAPPIGVARQTKRATLDVLWPLYRDEESEAKGAPTSVVSRADPILGVNDNSLVLRLRVGNRSVLFPGDIEEESENLLVSLYGAALGSDIVKVPHHGSRTSSTEKFAKVVRPAIALISCGRANRFGFPAAEVQTRWRHYADQVLRTDQVGSVTVEIDEAGGMQIKTAAPF